MKDKRFLELGQEIVAKALGQGAPMVEVYLLKSKDIDIEVSQGKVETLKLAEDQGLGVRVFKNQKIGYAYTSDLRDSALDQVIQSAINNSHSTEADENYLLPKPSEVYPKMDLIDTEISNTSMQDKIELAKDIERVAYTYDPRIKITETAAYSDAQYLVAIVNSEGIAVEYEGSYVSAYAYLVAEENGESQTGFGLQYGLKYKELDPKKIGLEAAEKAVRMLGAKEIKSQKVPIVLDPRIGASFLGLLAAGFSGDAVQKGKSLLADKLNHKIASSLVNIIDDGQLEGAIMSSPFDGEGVATSRTLLVDKGVLKGFLHNSYTGKKEDTSSTGNARRGSFKSTPEVGITNLFIEAGTSKPQSIKQNLKTGLYITEVLGMHTANPISGDFSVGVAGLWIENGEFTFPVRGIALGGNILTMFSQIEAIGDDLQFFGSKGAPTMQLAPMAISGG